MTEPTEGTEAGRGLADGIGTGADNVAPPGSPTSPAGAGDDVLDALGALETAAQESLAQIKLLIERIRRMRAERHLGSSYRDIVEAEERPGIVALASTNVATLTEALSTLRRAHAHALHREGMTMDQIAELFGVTRQRISALLRQ